MLYILNCIDGLYASCVEHLSVISFFSYRTLTPAMDQAKNLTRSFLVLLPAMMHSVVQLNTLGTVCICYFF